MPLGHRLRRWKAWLPAVFVGMVPLLCGGTRARVADVHAWRWQRTITLAHPAQEQCVVLDAEVYARSAPGLRDVRLLQEGREVAYALEESSDEHYSPAGGAPDRSLFTTVLQVPLHRAAAGSGQSFHVVGSGVLPARVPVERILFVPSLQEATQRSKSFIAGQSQHFRLVATTTTDPLRPAAAASEEIEGEVAAAQPSDLTAIGANLQDSATIDVAVDADSETYASVSLQMRQRSLCFQPRSEAPLLLVLGNDAARPVRYDYALHYKPVAVPLLGALGPVERNPTYRAAPRAQAFHVSRTQRLVLASAAVIAAVLLLTLPLITPKR